MTKPNRYSSTTSPPPRPAKSNLRTITAEKLLNATNSIRKQGRFIEHFEQLPPQELLDIINDDDDKSMKTNRPRLRTISSTTLNGSTIQNTSTITTSSTPLPTTTPSSEGDNYFPPLQRPLSRKLSTASHRSMTASLSTPPSQTLSSATTSTYARSSRRRHYSTATTSIYRRPSSTLANSVVGRSSGARKLSTLFSLNRAAVIISRLEQWLQLIKCVVQWLEETAKLHLQISRGYSQRHMPLFQMELQPDQAPAASTLYAGLRLLTTNVADANHHFAGNLQKQHIPALLKFKRECKEKIRVLRNDPRLLLDELLQRAEQTKKCMDQLNKVCQLAENHQQQTQHHRHEKSTLSDPWLANLYVLRQLKREIDEENRLRHLMVPIQKETADFETRLLATLKPAVQYCCEYLAPEVWNGQADEETASFQLLMDRILPAGEWQHFYDREEKELVDEQQVAKDYLNINYNNKLHDMVVTLKKGTMQRYVGGVRTKFSDRLYVLSQGGYLHQFRMDDKVVPERSIYIPHATVSSLDDCTFEIRRPTHGGSAATAEKPRGSSAGSDITNTSQRQKKVYVIKANSTEEMQSWCQILSEMAAGRLAVRRPRKYGRVTMIQQQKQEQQHEHQHQQEIPNVKDLTQLEDDPSTDSLVSSVSSTSRAWISYRQHFENHELPPLPTSTSSSILSVPASPVTLSSSSTSSKDQTQQPSPSLLANEHFDMDGSLAKPPTYDDTMIIHTVTKTSLDGDSRQLDEHKVGMVGIQEDVALAPLQDSNNSAAPPSLTDSHQQESLSTHQSDENSMELNHHPMHEGKHSLDEHQQQQQRQQQQYLEDTTVDNDDSDDTESTVSSHGSVSTVTRRYSLLPTSSNNERHYDDDDNISVHTIYDDAASHISHLSISTTSTQYDDAASSLYFSSNMSTRSTNSSSPRSSIEFDGYQHTMVIPDLEEQHA